jgi:antitoxin HicB
MTPKSPGGEPYPITLLWDESSDGYSGWVAAIDALPGCVSQGSTPEEAVDGLTDVTRDWIAVAQQSGTPIPEPRSTDDYSGRFIVRAPSSLHERLVQEAALERISLNQFVTNALAGAVGWRVHRSDTAIDAMSYTSALRKAADRISARHPTTLIKFVDLATGDPVEAPAAVEIAEPEAT